MLHGEKREKVGIGLAMGSLYSVEWNGGMEWWNGTVEWNGGMERWNGMVEWNGGMEWWNGTVEWNGGMEWWNDHAHRAPSVTTYTHHICNKYTQVRELWPGKPVVLAVKKSSSN